MRGHRVVAVDRRWVDLGQDSFWSICIDYLDGDGATRAAQRAKSAAKDYKELLSADDFAVFAKLRDLRKEVAQAEAVPVYTIFTNEQLATMVQNRVRDKAGLEAIAGVGDGRIEKYGPRFLACLGEAWKLRDATDGKPV
jgi:superfamily II DNA helicase RecQ